MIPELGGVASQWQAGVSASTRVESPGDDIPPQKFWKIRNKEGTTFFLQTSRTAALNAGASPIYRAWQYEAVRSPSQVKFTNRNGVYYRTCL